MQFCIAESDVAAQTGTIEEVNLSDERVHTVCPIRPDGPGLCNREQTRIRVNSNSRDAKKRNLEYVYFVSDGKVEGQGANVIWDLSEAGSGKFFITVGLGRGGVMKGRTITKTVSVDVCPVCDLACECPTLSLFGPEGAVRGGDAFVVRLNIEGVSFRPPIKTSWTVSVGASIETQGRFQILVRSDPKIKRNAVEVRVEFNAAGLCSACPTGESISIPIVPGK